MADVVIENDDPFVDYDFGTHGMATTYTFTGWSMHNYLDEFDDLQTDEAVATFTIYGTDDLELSWTEAPDEAEDDYEWDVTTGTLFAIEVNGEVPGQDDVTDLTAMPYVYANDDVSLLLGFGMFVEEGSMSVFLNLDGPKYYAGDIPTDQEHSDFLVDTTPAPTATGSLVLAEMSLVEMDETDIVPLMPDYEEPSLCELFGEDFDYGAIIDGMFVTEDIADVPLVNLSGPLMTLDGPVADDQMLTPDYKQAVKDIADGLDSLPAGMGLRVYDFESQASGNFAGSASAYVAAAGELLDHQTGAMADGTASGALSPDDFLTIYLFNTGNDTGTAPSDPGDDPGVATHEGNDADRGFNMSATDHAPSGAQYLEVLPGEDTEGGVVLCFNEPAYGFGFNLMGREDDKRDVKLLIHMSDGTIYRTTTDTHTNGTGGAQYVSYMLDETAEDGAYICAVVLYEPQPELAESPGDRDIFSIDDLVVVTDEGEGTVTSDEMKSNTRDAETDDCYDHDEDSVPFTEYDEPTHGDATVYTLSGFGFAEYDIGGGASGDGEPDPGAEEDDPAPDSIDAVTLSFFGSDDLSLNHMLDPDWEMLEDGSHPMEWELNTGMLFAVTYNGEPIDFNYEVEFELVDVIYDADDTDGIIDFDSRILEVNIDDGTGLSYSGFFYISGDTMGVDGVPTVEEFMTIGNALDEEAGPSSATYVADDTLVLGDLGVDYVDISTTTTVPEMPEVMVSMPLCCLLQQDSFDYEVYLNDLFISYTQPYFLNDFISTPMELDGPVAEDQTLEQQVVDSVQDFADAVTAVGGGVGFRLYDFESHTAGNYADSTLGYVPAAGETVDNVSGDMASGTATGTLQPDGFAAFHLFNTGHSVGTPPSIGDDPGVATHTGNDADRGFNITSMSGGDFDGEQYLEVLPSEQQGGGLIVCFDGPVMGFGFHLMGREDNKRDVYLDIHLTDGSVYRSTTGTNAENTGGLQYISYLQDVDANPDVSIQGFVLYEPLEAEQDASHRDIFSIDDLALVTTSDFVTHTPADLIDLTRMSDDEGVDAIPLNGTEGDDLLQGTDSVEAITALGGNDTIEAGGGNDSVDAGAGNDSVLAGAGDDMVIGYGGSDTIRGEAGADSIDGKNGNDWIYGGSEDDYLVGWGGRDRLRGNDGNDTMVGGNKNDFMQGGNGADVFVFNTDNGHWGKDFIKDFELGVDRVEVHGFTDADITWKAKGDGSGVIAKVAGGGNIVFNNLTEGDLADFSDWDFL